MGYYSCSNPITIIFLFLFVLSNAASFNNTKCPFDYLFHFGDGVTDIGNSVRVLPWGPSLPPASLPYGRTFPGTPNGRWSDGFTVYDFAVHDIGFPQFTPYLSRNATSSNGVFFSMARSPVLDHKFFKSRGIKIPPYSVSLHDQLRWFKTYLRSICSTRKDCKNILRSSLISLGDTEGNDIGYPLSQGKSIKQVKKYVPFVTQAQIHATRELIRMGATRIVIPGSAPIGCYPYILTARRTNNSKAYDNLGCLKNVNKLITFKNNDLQQAIKKLTIKFPNVSIFYAAFDQGVLQLLRHSISGSNGNNTLKACCGIGGKYNYSRKRFCGTTGVPICLNPNEYIFWDGLHFTHRASLRIEQILIRPALSLFNCTS